MEFQKTCQRKTAGFSDRQSVPVSHQRATPHRGLRAVVRTVIANKSLQHSAEFPSISMGKIGVRKPAVTRMLRSLPDPDRCEDADNTFDEMRCGQLVGACISAPRLVEVSDIVRDAAKRPKDAIKRPAAPSDVETTASGQVSESESRGSLEAPAICVEEPVLSEDSEQVQPDDATEAPVPRSSRLPEEEQFIREVQKREDLLRSVVVQLQSQRADVEKENTRLQQELLVKESLLSAVETKQPQLCLKQAKRLEQQRSKRTQKQLKQQRQQEQQMQLEIDAARREAERQASEITTQAFAHADAIREAAKQQSAAVDFNLLQRKMEQSQLQDSIEQQQAVVSALTEKQQEVLKDMDDKRRQAAEQLLHVQSEFQDTLARKHDAQVAAIQASKQLQSVLAAVEQQTEKLQVLAAQETMAVVSAEAATAVVQDSLNRQPEVKADKVNLKSAKELERQRAQRLNRQAAHQRSLKRQKEAELCRMRDEIEAEKTSMLAAAQTELFAIRASIKSQSQVLRQKKRRAKAVREAEPAMGSPSVDEVCHSKEEQLHEELAQIQEMPAAGDSCFDSPDHQDAASSVESAEVADSSNEDEVPEVEAQLTVHEDATVEEDWQVLSDGSEDDEATWDLVG